MHKIRNVPLAERTIHIHGSVKLDDNWQMMVCDDETLTYFSTNPTQVKTLGATLSRERVGE